MKRAALLLVVLAFLLSGCADRARHSGPSYSGPVPEAAAERIARDAAQWLVALYPPGHTSLYLHRPEPAQGRKPAVFDGLLENHLRAKGFRIVPEPLSAIPQVSWIVDVLPDHDADRAAQPAQPAKAGNPEAGCWYLRLAVSDRERQRGRLRLISRVYDDLGQAQAGTTDGTVIED